MTRAILLLAVTALVGCGGAAGVMGDTACASFAPILISRQDVLTPITAQQILKHNQAWEAKSCPRP